MRIDKFLKVSRIIKRRSVAKEVCDNARVTINSNVAKASALVKVDDIIEIRFGDKTSRFRVLELRAHVPQDQAKNLYEVVE